MRGYTLKISSIKIIPSGAIILLIALIAFYNANSFLISGILL